MNKGNDTVGNRGFTLVEAIVTAVLVAVLATAGVMMYKGFITESRHQTVKNLAEAGAAAANAYVRKTGENLTEDEVDKLHLYYDSTKYSVSINPSDKLINVTDREHSTIHAEAGY